MNADNAGELQTIKTLDSLETKIERMRVTIQEFYTSSGLEQLYKSILDIITNVVSAMNSLPKAFGKIPIVALTVGMQVINSIKTILTYIITSVQTTLVKIKKETLSKIDETGNEGGQHAEQAGRKLAQRFKDGWDKIIKTVSTPEGRSDFWKNNKAGIGMALNTAGSAITTIGMNNYGNSRDADEDRSAGVLTGVGTAASVIGQLLSGNYLGAAITGITGAVTVFKMYNVTTERELELAQKRIDQAHQEAVLRKGEADDLKTSLDKLKQLEEAQYSSNEAMEEYIAYRNQLAEQYPELISHYTGEHDAVIDLADGYALLAQKRLAAAEASTAEAKERREEANTITGVASAALDKYNSQYDFLSNRWEGRFNPFQGATLANSLIYTGGWLAGINSSDVN